MAKSKYFLSLIIFQFFILAYLNGQETGIGEWRDHLPYNSTLSVTGGNGKIYCASPYSIFYFDKNDNSLNRMTRISGLSDIGIARIGYNNENKTLMVAYKNTNLDLVQENAIINMPDILNSNAITPEEKSINNLMFIGDLAYISCGFGVVVVNIKKREIVETWYIGPNGDHLQVFDLAVNDTAFFAATEHGIYFANKNNPNLAFFGSWSRDETVPDAEATFSYITINAGKIYTSKYTEEYGADSILVHYENQWHNRTDLFTSDDVFGLKTYNNTVYVIYRYRLMAYDENLNEIKNLWSYFNESPLPRDIFLDNSVLWIADDENGLVRENSSYDYTLMGPNGPKSSEVYSMSIEGEDLWIVPGGRDLSWNNLWKRASASSFTDGMWKTVDRFSDGAQTLEYVHDLLCVAVNPLNTKQVFAGSWSTGLVQFTDDAYDTFYTPENSSLEYKLNQGAPTCKVGGLAFDPSGNLWVVNSGANNILSVRVNDGSALGEWRSFYLGSLSTGKDIGDLIIDAYGQKWIMWRSEHSVIVFNNNNTPLDPTDDQVKTLSNAQNNGAIPGTKLLSVACDKDGEVWVGTDEGIAVFYSPENIFSQYNFDAQRILIPRNDGTGLADILLEFESVTAIAVDGANNKWIGTDRSGVYKFSPDGLTQLEHFTSENSPLFSNNITSIAINNKNGEVFFGTALGIISFKSTATEGGTTNTGVFAYPNPVRPEYSGPIAIKGLVNNAIVKITSINGSLVYSTEAQGGQAIWNGTNFSGSRAQSGVYLVFITNSDGSETMVTKILLIN